MTVRQQDRYQLGHLEDYTAFLGNGVMASQWLTSKSIWTMEFLRRLTSTDRLLKKIREDRERGEIAARVFAEERAASEKAILDALAANRKQLMRKLEAMPAQMEKWLKEIAKIDRAVSIIQGC